MGTLATPGAHWRSGHANAAAAGVHEPRAAPNRPACRRRSIVKQPARRSPPAAAVPLQQRYEWVAKAADSPAGSACCGAARSPVVGTARGVAARTLRPPADSQQVRRDAHPRCASASVGGQTFGGEDCFEKFFRQATVASSGISSSLRATDRRCGALCSRRASDRRPSRTPTSARVRLHRRGRLMAGICCPSCSRSSPRQFADTGPASGGGAGGRVARPPPGVQDLLRRGDGGRPPRRRVAGARRRRGGAPARAARARAPTPPPSAERGDRAAVRAPSRLADFITGRWCTIEGAMVEVGRRPRPHLGLFDGRRACGDASNMWATAVRPGDGQVCIYMTFVLGASAQVRLRYMNISARRPIRLEPALVPASLSLPDAWECSNGRATRRRDLARRRLGADAPRRRAALGPCVLARQPERRVRELEARRHKTVRILAPPAAPAPSRSVPLRSPPARARGQPLLSSTSRREARARRAAGGDLGAAAPGGARARPSVRANCPPPPAPSDCAGPRRRHRGLSSLARPCAKVGCARLAPRRTRRRRSFGDRDITGA